MSYEYIYYQKGIDIPASVYYFDNSWDNFTQSNEQETDLSFWLGEEGDQTLPPKISVSIPSHQNDFYPAGETHTCEYFRETKLRMGLVSYYNDTFATGRAIENQRRYLSFWLGIEADSNSN